MPRWDRAASHAFGPGAMRTQRNKPIRCAFRNALSDRAICFGLLCIGSPLRRQQIPVATVGRLPGAGMFSEVAAEDDCLAIGLRGSGVRFGQKQTFRSATGMCALPLKADSRAIPRRATKCVRDHSICRTGVPCSKLWQFY
jgi:hypothetical protein